jgi:hypothetical protein
MCCAATRSIIYCTYITIVLAIVLTVGVKLSLDQTTVWLPSPVCADADVLRGSAYVVFACVRNDSGGGTVWQGEVSGLSPFSGDVTLAVQLTNNGPKGVTVPAAVFTSRVEGRTIGKATWNPLFQQVNGTLSAVGVDGGKAVLLSLVNSFDDTDGQGGGGFNVYRLTAEYNLNLTQYASVQYRFQ